MHGAAWRGNLEIVRRPLRYLQVAPAPLLHAGRCFHHCSWPSHLRRAPASTIALSPSCHSVLLYAGRCSRYCPWLSHLRRAPQPWLLESYAGVVDAPPLNLLRDLIFNAPAILRTARTAGGKFLAVFQPGTSETSIFGINDLRCCGEGVLRLWGLFLIGS